MTFVFKKKETSVDIEKIIEEMVSANLFNEEESIRKNMIRCIEFMLKKNMTRKDIISVLQKIFVDNSKNYMNTLLYEVKKNMNS